MRVIEAPRARKVSRDELLDLAVRPERARAAFTSRQAVATRTPTDWHPARRRAARPLPRLPVREPRRFPAPVVVAVLTAAPGMAAAATP